MVNGELGTSDPPLGSSFNSESSQLSMFLVRGIHCQQHIGGASGDLCRVISVYDFSYLYSAAPGAHTILGLHINLAWLVRALGKSVELKSPQVRNSSPFYSSVFLLHHTINTRLLSCVYLRHEGLMTSPGLMFGWLYYNDKRSSKSATSFSHSHSLTNWYTGYMLDDQ